MNKPIFILTYFFFLFLFLYNLIDFIYIQKLNKKDERNFFYGIFINQYFNVLKVMITK